MTTAGLDIDLGELADAMDDMRGVDDDLDIALDALARIAVKASNLQTPVRPEWTQSVIATIAGSSDGTTDMVGVFALLVRHLSHSDTNPGLRTLPAEWQKQAARHGEDCLFQLTDPELHQPASETSAAICGI